jgi:hypothetical protein
MTSPLIGAERPSFLPRVEIVTAQARYPLGGAPIFNPANVTTTQTTQTTQNTRPLTLASEAMRWSYVLRSRERWRDSPEVTARHQQDATLTLNAFGLSDAALQAIAVAGRVVVTMPFESEGWGWEARIFPWEFVLSRATRRYRVGSVPGLTVMRHMTPVSQPPLPPRQMAGRVLFVQSLPGALAQDYDVAEEAERVRRACGLAADDTRWRVLANPTLDELWACCASYRPELVHLTGFDNHQGLIRLADSAGSDAPLARGDQRKPVGEWLRDDKGVIDGYLMRRSDGLPLMVSPQELARALTAGHTQRPFFVGLNLWNSAARIAPQLLPAGVLASMGFQDAFDDALAEYFFETLYRLLPALEWRVPDAFEQAWAATRKQVDLVPGTGVALWARAPLIERAPRARAGTYRAGPEAAPVRAATPLTAAIEPRKEFNYAELHNQGDYAEMHNQSALFERFELRGTVEDPPAKVQLVVELNCGLERARYEAEVALTQERMSLKGKIKVPLTATLMRSVSEAVVSSLFVQVSRAEQIVHKNTYAMRLLPVDQWLDNAISGQWLPSFVLPRDPAVERAVALAQRYVRVIRDDPSAGFEGYQSANADDQQSLDSVDLQVEAIWSALLHEWQLGYINPPPTYNRALDSQRLRTPSAVFAGRMGTCIDLALLFAACLELVDIHPVVFLLDGHALPGYWRHRDFQLAYRELTDIGDTVAQGDEERTSTPGAQTRPWRVGRSGYREVWKLIREGQLAPLETVRLTEHCGFREAREAGVEALRSSADFDSILDIAIAREHQVTPLPIVNAGVGLGVGATSGERT